MNMKEESKQAVSLQTYNLPNKPVVIVTDKLRRQIDFLHFNCPGIEWSGELITHEEGTINTPDTWKIICEEVFLTDVGTAGYTSYEVDKGGFKAPDIVELYEKFPGLLEGEKKVHHLHTHHSMGK